MEARTKWIIGISTAMAIGVTAFATKKYWMPLFSKKYVGLNEGIIEDAPILTTITREENTAAIKEVAKKSPPLNINKPLTKVEPARAKIPK